MKNTKNTKGTENVENAQTIEELRAELAQANAELAAESAAKAELAQALEVESAAKAELAQALEAAKKARTSKKSARPAHVEFLKSAPARAVLAIAATGKQATAIVPAYLAVTLLSGGSHATGAARQMALLVSRGVSYTGGVLPNLFPPAIAERFDALKEDIQLVTGWLELVGLNDDYNIIPKESLQAIVDAPESARSIYVQFLNDLRLQALAVQKKAFAPEDFKKIEEASKEVLPWDFEDWEVSPAE